ncbi:MAG TPA: hypothetical protein VES97_12140 [Solirubrobacteraceae bacterium]|nr:hypothetical protein [Solirubrobacteraceae bacterium]
MAIMQWTAGLGAVTAEALADREGSTVASARARLLAAERERLLSRQRPLAGQPALYAVTRAGLRVSGLRGLEPCRVSTANAAHTIACAGVAAALERCYPDHRVLGERELRRDERECGAELASARLGYRPDGGPLLHRPDLVLWPKQAPASPPGGLRESSVQADGRPVAVEVELTVKAPRRLLEICRAWARCRCVAGVLYLASPEVESALARAIEKAQAAERVVALPFDALPSRGEAGRAPTERTVPGDA